MSRGHDSRVPAAASTRSAAGRVARSDSMQKAARVGLAAHGFVYVLIGVLAVSLAFGATSQRADQNGALQELASHTGGWILVLVIGLGLAAYALWQASRALLGNAEARERAKAGFSAVSNAVLAASAFTVLVEGHASNQSRSQQSMTARLMRHTGGQWLIGILGVVVVGIGVVLIVRGAQRKFERDLDLGGADETVRRAVITVGVVGTVARGVVVAAVGVLFIVAAWQFNPRQARGLDGALLALRDTALGPWLLVVVGVGLMMFGAYGIAESKYRRL